MSIYCCYNMMNPTLIYFVYLTQLPLHRNMLKGFKLNTINMSSQIFTISSQSSRTQQPNLKISSNLNKKFKYNYKKSTNFLNFTQKQRNHTVDLEDRRSQQQTKLKTIQEFVRGTPKITKQKIQKRRSNSSRTYVNNFVFHPNKYSKRAISHHSKQSDEQNMERNKTEKTMHKQTIDHQTNYQNSPEEAQVVKIDGFQQRLINKIKKDQPRMSTTGTNERQFTSRTQDKMGSRATSKTKYTNSIIQSYKIKSIELIHPFSNKASNKKTSIVAYPYYLDLTHYASKQEIQFDEIEQIQQIQLQKVKYENRRAFSNHHCKQRPATSKPPKVQDFQPQPWEIEENQGFQFKDSIVNS